jgi:hypothetical protein
MAMIFSAEDKIHRSPIPLPFSSIFQLARLLLPEPKIVVYFGSESFKLKAESKKDAQVMWCDRLFPLIISASPSKGKDPCLVRHFALKLNVLYPFEHS